MIKRKGNFPRPSGLKRTTGILRASRGIPKSGTKPKKKRSFIEKWTLKKADEQFSLFIRHRDGKCVRCGVTKENDQLQNSHFWGRIWKGTRYDPENCDTLCATCHYWGDSKRGIVAWEEEKQGAYMRFKLNQLGRERYDAMELRAHADTKNDKEVLKCRQFLALQEYEGKPKYLSTTDVDTDANVK